MSIQNLTSEQILKSLNSSPDGLTGEQASQRLHEYGYNLIQRAKEEPILLALAKQFIHFFAIILWLAASLAFFADYQSPGEGMFTLGFAIVLVILINGFFSFWQEYRAKQAISALQKLLPLQVKTVRAGNLISITTDLLVPGDIVVLQEGDNVPADCRLLDASTLRVNYATITGESLPRGCDAEPSTSDDILNCRNILLAGTIVVSGEAQAVVFATGMNTEFGKIAHLSQATINPLSPLQKEIILLSRIIGFMAVILGLVFFLIGETLGMPFWTSLIFGIGIIVASVPEGLLPTVTLSLAMATQRMAKRNALIRNLSSVEALGAATVICTDKTGTLTQNSMHVEQAWLGGQLYNLNNMPSIADSYRKFFEVAGLCHNLRMINGKWHGDPMEIALLALAESFLSKLPSYTKVGEIPFDTERKRLSTLHNINTEKVLYCKGAPEVLLPRCQFMETASGMIALNDEWQSKIAAAQQSMADKGLRVLCLASRHLDSSEYVDLEQEMTFSGLVGLADPIRPEVPEAVKKCHEAGIKVIMLTGDHPHTALAVARQVSLATSASSLVITGDQLKKMSRTQLQIALDTKEIIFARVGADQKMLIVQALKRKRHIVAVTGDGVNDTPALRAADIGIAMGVSGTDAAKSAADMILLDDNFSSIVAAVEEGRAVFDNIRKFLAYILTSNVPELVPYLAFALFKIPLALTVPQILLVDLGTDIVPALGLGAEKPDAEIMKRAPRSRKERLLDSGLIVRAFCFLGIMEAIIAMSAFFLVLGRGGWQYNQVLSINSDLYRQATTATLSAIILAQIVNVFLCRSTTRSVFKTSLFSNNLLMIGIGIEIAILAIINYASLGNYLFATAPLDWKIWLYVMPFAAAMIFLEELRKYWVRNHIGIVHNNTTRS
ncbi:MAG: cation-transporting P-type ATPase [Legionella sp.]|jgi:calcium-translocating P-type ATPase|nr:cation-transporting P-type ATPase [Legionella sp.]